MKNHENCRENAMGRRRHAIAGWCAGLLLVIALAPGAQAQTAPKLKTSGVESPASALWVGNSFFYYNNSMHGHVSNILAATEPHHRFRQSSVTISGSGIDWHDLESYFRPNAIGGYSFNARNEVVFNKIDRLFDLAIMMDCSQCPIHPTLAKVFTEYAKKNADIARKHGAKPVFFMSWAYEDKPEMTEALAEAYVKAANENDVFVIPTGLAFARAIAKRPDIHLYVADKRHPSLAGTYLAAATVYAALFGKSPVGNGYDPGIGKEATAFLQTIAHETVTDFFKR
jgi:hypothetical protein